MTSKRPQAITEIQSSSEAAAQARAEGGGPSLRISSESHTPTLGNTMVWKSPAFTPAAMMRHILTANTGLEMKSEAWAVNIMSPLGTMRRNAAALHGSTWLASLFTEMLLEKPSNRRSRIAIEPKSSPMPTMWTISTAG